MSNLTLDATGASLAACGAHLVDEYARAREVSCDCPA